MEGSDFNNILWKKKKTKKRIVIDYSQTISWFPLSRIDEKVVENAKYKFLTLGTSKALKTAFEAREQLYQFLRIPFGVMKWVANFQRVIHKIITNERLQGTYAYIDNVTVCGYDRTDHNHNLKRFLAGVEKYNLTFNNEKCSYWLSTINLLEYVVSQWTMAPDPERLKPLLELPIRRLRQCSLTETIRTLRIVLL